MTEIVLQLVRVRVYRCQKCGAEFAMTRDEFVDRCDPLGDLNLSDCGCGGYFALNRFEDAEQAAQA